MVSNIMHRMLIALAPVLSGAMPAPFIIAFAKGSAKLSAAKALPKRPARVIATCIVESTLDWSFVRESRRFAFLFPSSASFFNLASFTEMTAISVPANTALSAISNICTTIAKM